MHLSKLADEAAAWATGAVLAFVLAVVLALKANAVRVVATAIQNMLRGLVDRSAEAPGDTDEDAATAAQKLAQGVGQRLENAKTHLKLKAPRSLKVSWREVSADGTHIPESSLAGALDEVKMVFDRVRAGSGEERPGRLVVLGPGGSGKSVLLQELALEMLKDPDPAGTVPVIFNLSSWETGTELDEWLTAQLLRLRYAPSLGEEKARSIVANRLVLPLLDGFDEVGAASRAELMDKLNEEADRELVLTSRREEYLDTITGRRKGNGTVLSDAAVIQLDGLPLEEVTKYLTDLPYRRARHEDDVELAWEPVTHKLGLKRKPAAARRLAEVFETPLMVAIARDVYRNEDPAELLNDSAFTSVEEIENHLLDNFIPAIYDAKAKNPSRWGEDKARRAFRYLASRPEPRGSGSHRQDIAWWEIGTAGMTRWKRSLLTGLAGGLVMALMYGIAAFAALIVGYRPVKISAVSGFAAVSGDIMMASFAFGFVHWLVAKYKNRLLEPSRVSVTFVGRPRGGRRCPRNVIRRFLGGLGFGGIAGFAGICGVTGYIVVLASLGIEMPFESSEPIEFAVLLLVGIFGITLVAGILVGLAALLEAPVEEKAVGPLALLAVNRRIAILGGLAVTLLGGAVTGIVDGMLEGSAGGIWSAAIGGVTLGAGGVVCMTSWGQWVVFCRLWLPLTGKLPWRAHAFLDDAHQRGVLRQIGGVYQFRHARLQARILQTTSGRPDPLSSAERPRSRSATAATNALRKVST